MISLKFGLATIILWGCQAGAARSRIGGKESDTGVTSDGNFVISGSTNSAGLVVLVVEEVAAGAPLISIGGGRSVTSIGFESSSPVPGAAVAGGAVSEVDCSTCAGAGAGSGAAVSSGRVAERLGLSCPDEQLPARRATAASKTRQRNTIPDKRGRAPHRRTLLRVDL